MRPACVAAVVLRVAERGEQARDRVGIVAPLPRESERVREPVHRFVVRAHRLGAFAGAHRELDRVASAADVRGRGKVVCELGGESVDVVVVIRLDRLRDPLVQLRTPRGAETVEQNLAHERMVEPQHRAVGRRLDEHTRPPHHLDRGEQVGLGKPAGPGDDARARSRRR